MTLTAAAADTGRCSMGLDLTALRIAAIAWTPARKGRASREMGARFGRIRRGSELMRDITVWFLWTLLLIEILVILFCNWRDGGL